MAQIAPAEAMACAYGTINALSLAGHRADGRRWVMFSFFGGGHGGHPRGDGLNHGNAPISTATIPPLEILEAAYPVKFTKWSLRPDSGGPGNHRGGLGAIYEIELLEKEADVFLFGERGRFPPPGVVDGGPGALNAFRTHKADGDHVPPMASKIVGVHIDRGDYVRLESPGGGGYGRAFDRDPASVAGDVRLGFVSRTSAEEDYGVALRTDGSVDDAATRSLRDREIAR
jgi:N-methylhydantoinase B